MIGYLPYSFVLFPPMYVLVCYVISRKGWAQLAAQYRYDEPFEEERLGLRSLSVGSAQYRNAIVLRAAGAGLYLRPLWPFRLFHPPLLIPWRDFRDVRQKTVLFHSWREARIGRPPVTTIGLDEKTFQQIAPYLQAPRLPQ